MKRRVRRRRSVVSTILIFVGALLLFTVLVYEAVNYPWMAQFARWGLVEMPSLPEPPPLPSAVDGVRLTGGEESGRLPGQPGWQLSRPPAYLQWLGVIKLPAMGLSANIIEGVGDELLYGVGHESGTALPGQEGNCFLAGHRNYIYMRPFRFLDLLQIGDEVMIEYEKKLYTYEVYEILTVEPTDTWVRDPVEGEPYVLSLMTCTPVANPVYRMIVRCKLTGYRPLEQSAVELQA